MKLFNKTSIDFTDDQIDKIKFVASKNNKTSTGEVCTLLGYDYKKDYKNIEKALMKLTFLEVDDCTCANKPFYYKGE